MYNWLVKAWFATQSGPFLGASLVLFMHLYHTSACILLRCSVLMLGCEVRQILWVG